MQSTLSTLNFAKDYRNVFQIGIKLLLQWKWNKSKPCFQICITTKLYPFVINLYQTWQWTRNFVLQVTKVKKSLFNRSNKSNNAQNLSPKPFTTVFSCFQSFFLFTYCFDVQHLMNLVVLLWFVSFPLCKKNGSNKK